jgi:hypothetical protein
MKGMDTVCSRYRDDISRRNAVDALAESVYEVDD